MSTDEVLEAELDVIVSPDTEGESRPGAASDPGPGSQRSVGGRRSWARVLLHPITSYERDGRRFLPGLWFPVTVFVCWRLAHLAIVALVGGDVAGSPVAYDGVRYLAGAGPCPTLRSSRCCHGLADL